MSEILLTGSPPSPPQQQAPGSGAPGRVTDPPASLLRLAQGSLLHGVVTGQAQGGQLLVQTEQGLLQVATKLPLPVGREVALQIRAAGSQLHITILPLEATAPGGTPAAPPAPGQPAAPGTTAQPPLPAAAPAAGPGAGPGAAPGGPTGQIREPPPSAARLPVGSQLVATVLHREPDGSYLLRSELGSLRLATEAPLARGSSLTLQIRQSVSELQVLVLPRPGAGGAAPLTAGAQGSNPAAASTDRLQPGPLLRALVLGAPTGGGTATPGTAGPAPGAPSLPAAGAWLAVRLQQILPPSLPPGTSGGGPAPAAGGAPGFGGVRASPASSAATSGIPASAGGPASGATGTTGAPAGTPLQGNVLSALSGLGPQALARATDLSAAARAPETAGLLQGRVIGQSASGEPLLETPIGRLQLALRAELPLGARLLLALPQGLTPPEAPLPAAGLSEAASLAKGWPALEGLLRVIEEAGAAQQAAARAEPGPTVPQPGPRLASGLLFFLNALTGGDPGAWLDGLMGGQAKALLESRGRQELLGRLRGDLARMAGLAEAAGPDWRLLPVPFFDGQTVQQLRFFLRRQDESDGGRRDEGEEEATTRFLLDVELTRLGALQFDGLVRAKRFDMILRSRAPLPGWMQSDILRIFESANSAAGAAGRLSFQASGAWSPLAVAEGGGALTV